MHGKWKCCEYPHGKGDLKRVGKSADNDFKQNVPNRPRSLCTTFGNIVLHVTQGQLPAFDDDSSAAATAKCEFFISEMPVKIVRNILWNAGWRLQ